MDVVSLSTLRTGSLVWQPRRGSWVLTAVCKATFLLLPAESILATEQEYPNEDDDHWNDDPARSLYTPTDLVPFKPRADVMLVGHAFAPRNEPARSVVARIVVGEVDKAVEVWADRERLGRHAATWSPSAWSRQPMPDDLDPGFFDAAPRDQQVDALRANERIVQENLHAEHARLGPHRAHPRGLRLAIPRARHARRARALAAAPPSDVRLLAEAHLAQDQHEANPTALKVIA